MIVCVTVIKLIFLILSLLGKEPRVETCISTIFATPGDKWRGGPSKYLGRKVLPSDQGIAHRRLPLGSWVMVINTRTSAWSFAQVLDRGPYGAIHNDQWLIKKRKSDPGKWRGCADLTPPIARIIGHDGWDRVTIISW